MFSSRSAKERKANAKDTARRLYLAFHHRNPTAYDPSSLATSLVLVDKTPSPDAPTGWRWRVAKEESLSDDGGLAEWQFVTQGGMSIRSIRPLTVVLLGRVPLEVDPASVGNVLSQVDVREAELVWSTEPWLLNALAALQRASIIPSDVQPRTIITAGSKFAREQGYRPGITVIPTCGLDGLEIPSEIAKPA